MTPKKAQSKLGRNTQKRPLFSILFISNAKVVLLNFYNVMSFNKGRINTDITSILKNFVSCMAYPRVIVNLNRKPASKKALPASYCIKREMQNIIVIYVI